MAETSNLRSYQAGEVIVPQGQKDKSIFIVIEGVVVLSTTDDNEIEKKRFGVAEVLSPDDTATVIAKTDSELMIITREDFIAAEQTHLVRD